MEILRVLSLRFWAVRQFICELREARCWDDLRHSFEEEVLRTVLTGHINIGDLCGLYDEFPELLTRRVGMRQLVRMAVVRLRAAASMGLVRWGSYPGYCRAQEAHLRSCGRCQERLYTEVFEEVEQKNAVDSIIRRAGLRARQ